MCPGHLLLYRIGSEGSDLMTYVSDNYTSYSAPSRLNLELNHYQGSGSICTGSRGTSAINSSSSRFSAVLSRHAVNTVVSDPSDLILCD